MAKQLLWVSIGQGQNDDDDVVWKWAIYAEDPKVWASTPEAFGETNRMGDAYLLAGTALNALEAERATWDDANA